MSIVNDVVREILNKRLKFVRPEPDLKEVRGIQICPEIFEYEGVVERILSAEEDVLGQYQPMRSPGQIILFEERLSSFYWGLVGQISRNNYFMEESDLEKMAHMVVLKTYTHEQFHHFADVARHLFGSQYDHHLEEALAVAWSRKKLIEQRRIWQSKEARLAAPLYNELMVNMYHYRSSGYRDWVLYQSEDEFLIAISDYLGGSGKKFLEKSGISMGQILLRILDEVKDKGVVERRL